MSKEKKKYTKDEKEQIVNLFKGGRSKESLVDEFKMSKVTLNKWIREYKEEHQESVTSTEEELKRYKKLVSEKDKEIRMLKDKEAFLKKAAALFASESQN